MKGGAASTGRPSTFANRLDPLLVNLIRISNSRNQIATFPRRTVESAATGLPRIEPLPNPLPPLRINGPDRTLHGCRPEPVPT